MFTDIVEGPSVQKLISLGNLTKFEHYAPADLDFSGLRTRAGDYVVTDSVAFMSKQKIIGNIVQTYNNT